MKNQEAIKIISSAIRQGRKRRGWSQKELASLMGVVTSLVSKWENGKAAPTGETLFTLAIELDIVPLLFSDYFPQQEDDGSSEHTPSVKEQIKELKQENTEIRQRLKKMEDKFQVFSLIQQV